MGRFSWLFVLLLVGCQGARTGTAPDAGALGRMIDLGNAQQVAELLDQGADPDAKDAANVPLLHRAVERGDEAVVRTMLEHGADPNAPDAAGRTSLGTAIAGGTGELMPLLLKHKADPRVVAAGDWSPLHWAIGTQRLEWVAALLDAGVDPNGDDDGVPVLYVAAGNGTVEIIDLLVKRGAKVDGPAANSGRTPLFAAVLHSEGMTQALVDRGADLRARDKNGRTPLEYLKAEARNRSDPVLAKRVAFVEGMAR